MQKIFFLNMINNFTIGFCKYFRIDLESNDGCHLDELGDRLAQENERSYLRMVNRHHLYNSSNYSLSSLFRYLYVLLPLF